MKVKICLKKGRLRHQENRSSIKNCRRSLECTAKRAANSLLLLRGTDAEWPRSVTASDGRFDAG